MNEKSVRKRIENLAQLALLQHTQLLQKVKIGEPISYDGVENLAVSKYEPNYINQAIGMKSLFIYDFNFSPLNRKGDMSDGQKLKNMGLERKLGRYSRNAIRTSTTLLFSRLAARAAPAKLCVASDQHYQYRQSVERDLPKLKIEIDHVTISAKRPRVFKHILFPVNHADLLLRQRIKAFARKTISFSKTHEAMIQKYALFMVDKNYMSPQYTKRHKTNPLSNVQTPAQAAGIATRPLKFRDFFGRRLQPSQVSMTAEWRAFYSRTPTHYRIPPSKGGTHVQQLSPHN